MAILLHLDSSGPTGLVMLSREGKVLAIRRQEGEREHAAHLNGMISATLAEAGVGLSDVDAFVVCNGPGSYTGLRIALATAKGFCYTLEKPLILQNKLWLLLEEAQRKHPDMDRYAAILPARSGEYFFSQRRQNETIAPGHILTPELEISIQKHSDENILISGALHDDLQYLIQNPNVIFNPTKDPDPETWAEAGHLAFERGEHSDLAYSEPEYLKPAFITIRKS